MKNDQEGQYYVEGIPVPETPEPGEEPAPWEKTAIIGKKIPRVDGYARVSGAAIYPSDMVLPDMLFGAILRCPHPHARVMKVDAAEAEKMPGVRAVITGASPEADLQWGYSKKVKTALFDELCRFEGETVAAVAAETPYQARDALKAIRVEYEVLPYVVDERRALRSDAPKVHEGGNKLNTETSSRGDVERGFAEADEVVELEFRSEAEVHTPLELHGCLARWQRVP